MSNPQLDSLRTDVEIQKLSLEIEMIKGQIGHMGQVRTLQVEVLKAMIELIPDVKNIAKAILQKVEKKLTTTMASPAATVTEVEYATEEEMLAAAKEHEEVAEEVGETEYEELKQNMKKISKFIKA